MNGTGAVSNGSGTGLADRPANQGLPFVCYVRVRNRTANGLVEFDFAIGDPALYVEMVMPEENFGEFCARYAVRMVTAEEAARIDRDRAKWRYGEIAEAAPDGTSA